MKKKQSPQNAGYLIMDITHVFKVDYRLKKTEFSSVVVHLALLPENAQERRSMEKTLKRIGELESTPILKRYHELMAISKFRLSTKKALELDKLIDSPQVQEFLELSTHRSLLIGESATLSAPQGKFRVGDAIGKDAAESDPSFKLAPFKARLAGGNGPGSRK